jgi:hypothetical protein
MLMLPRVLLLMVLSVGTLLSTLLVGGWWAIVWATMLLTSISAYMLAAPPNTSAILKKDLAYLPHAGWGYIKGIIHSRTANRSFVHTSHGQTQNILDK